MCVATSLGCRFTKGILYMQKFLRYVNFMDFAVTKAAVKISSLQHSHCVLELPGNVTFDAKII